jgi:hypothetical protein
MKPKIMIMATVALALSLGGCSDTTGPAAPGELRIILVDAPGDFQAVNIVVQRVEAHRSAGNKDAWELLSDQTAVYDLLQLRNGVSALLAGALLPAGQYTQIRLILGAGNNVVVDGQAHPLTIPSGTSSGIKLEYPFTIESGRLQELIMDFDAGRSIHQTGGGAYVLVPVIRLMAAEASGSISGSVEPTFLQPIVRAVIGDETVTTTADLGGGFLLQPLREGTYTVTLDASHMGLRPMTLTGVVVVAGENTDLGQIMMGM